MHALRAQVFQSRLNWSVPVTAGQEVDRYDTDAARYMLMYDQDGDLCGCWRILPTTAPYMLAETFQELLHGAPPSRDPNVFELSRFALAAPPARGFGFSDAARRAMQEIVTWASCEGVREFVTVTTLGIERLLVHQGIDMRRYGPARRIGESTAVALRILLSEKTVVACRRAGEQPDTIVNTIDKRANANTSWSVIR